MSKKIERGKIESTVSFPSWYISEPLLIFANGKTHIDPKLGLTLYGPLRPEGVQNPLSSVKVGIIGTGETIGFAKNFIEKLNHGVPSGNKDPFQSASFPGFKKTFDCTLIQSDNFNSNITLREVNRVLESNTFEEKVNAAVQLFIDRIESLSEIVQKPDVILCALPQEIVEYCTVKRSAAGEIKKKTSKKEKKFIEKLKQYQEEPRQTFLDNYAETAEKLIESQVLSSNFWRILKANAMKFSMPTQIVWPSTLLNDPHISKSRQDDSATIWNISVALYYKGSGFPWTMTKMMKGTCYVGISFFKDLVDENKMRTSMAQIFTYTGEGLVLRGDKFEWDTEKGKSPHLTKDSAESLLEKAISLYEKRMKEPPTRVVIHKTSRYWEDEKKGFENILQNIVSSDLVAFGERGMRFFRYGQYPPLRGTVVQLSKNNYLLYTRGYTPYLRTYPGAHIPAPLDILEHFGDSPPHTILSEILSLSKMNWNSAEFSLARPITLLFSSRVGEVMATLPDNAEIKHEYLYYM